MNTRRLPIRIASYCLGLLLLAFGVTFSIKSSLGVSPVNSLPYVLSLISGFNQGMLTTGVFSFYILVQIIILRKEFKAINFLQIIFAGIFGYFVSFSNFLWNSLTISDVYILRLLVLCISMLLVALGLLFYLAADIVPQPAEGIMLAIHQKTGIEFSMIKVSFDVFIVLIAAAISIAAFGTLKGVREGTLLSAIGIGKLLGVLNRRYRKSIEAFLNKND